MEHPEVMSVKQAALYMGVSTDTPYVYLLNNSDGIPAFKLGNRWKIKKTLLDQWMVRQSERSRAFDTRRHDGSAS